MSRPRTPSVSNNTRPLNVPRSPSRPTTPSSALPRGPPPSTDGPSRPQRSELRVRSNHDNYDPARDSTHTDASGSYRQPRPSASGHATPPSSSRARTQKQRGPSMDDEDTSPVMSNIMSAFQAAGRRRGMTNDSMEYEHRSTRQVEVEQENKRQERIRARAPGRKNTGQARAGDVDGPYQSMATWRLCC